MHTIGLFALFLKKHYPHLKIPPVLGDPSGTREMITICQTEESDKASTVVSEGPGWR